MLAAAEASHAELNSSNGRQGRRTLQRNAALDKLAFDIAALRRGEWPSDARQRDRETRRAANDARMAVKHDAVAARAAHHAPPADLRQRGTAAAPPAAAAAAAANGAGAAAGPDDDENDDLPEEVDHNYFAISAPQHAFDTSVRDDMLKSRGGARAAAGFFVYPVPHFIESGGSARFIGVKEEYMYDPLRFWGGCGHGFCPARCCGPEHRAEITTKGLTRKCHAHARTRPARTRYDGARHAQHRDGAHSAHHCSPASSLHRPAARLRAALRRVGALPLACLQALQGASARARGRPERCGRQRRHGGRGAPGARQTAQGPNQEHAVLDPGVRPARHEDLCHGPSLRRGAQPHHRDELPRCAHPRAGSARKAQLRRREPDGHGLHAARVPPRGFPRRARGVLRLAPLGREPEGPADD